MPKTVTQGANAVSFGYDGDAQRIRKTTPVEETLYLGDLYEQVTQAATGVVAHRYYVHAPERVVAVVTRGGDQAGTRYLHVDHLGSVHALTDASGAVVERRTYDPFGQRRATVWGEPTPASFPSLTTQGFTGHESDDELGLVNMKGRIYDPKLGRFLTTDPIVAAPLFGQSWNPYSYVFNNPLNFVDPSGFAPGDGSVSQPGYPDVSLPDDVVTASPTFHMARYLNGGPPPGQPSRVQQAKSTEGPAEAAEVGAVGRPVDVSPTGSASGYVPQLAAVAGVPLSAPGVPGAPLGAPGAPLAGPLNAPGPFGPNAFGPGSFIEPPTPGGVPLQAPGVPTVVAEAPGVTIGGVLGGALFILGMGAFIDGDVHPRLPPPEPREYEIVQYKDKAPGFHNHHAVLDVWAHHNVPGYVKRAANSTTIRLSVPHHEATFAVFNAWLKEQTGHKIGKTMDWTTVTSREILELSERQFNAADVPASARQEYYRQFTNYLYGLK